MKFLGAGCSRIAYSAGNGICLKIPIKERHEAGVWQNKLEYENFKLGNNSKLVCFPKPKRHNRDFSKIWIEECKHIASEEYFLNLLNLGDEWSANLKKISEALKTTMTQFIGFWVFGWLEDINLENACKMSSMEIDELKAIIPFKNLDGIAKFLENIITRNTSWKSHALLVMSIMSRCKTILDIIKFKLNYPDRLLIRDIWNLGQWGETADGRLVVLDAGYNHSLANSHHFSKGTISKDIEKSEDLETFNGVKCSEMFSQTGSPIKWKFFTSHGTEYVMSSAGQSRRIKQAGLPDDGLHPWMDKIVFVNEKDAIDAMNAIISIQKTLTPAKISTTWEPQSKLDIQKLVEDQWKTQFSLVIQDIKPQIGKNVLEFNLDGSIIKSFHAGHNVAKAKYISN